MPTAGAAGQAEGSWRPCYSSADSFTKALRTGWLVAQCPETGAAAFQAPWHRGKGL